MSKASPEFLAQLIHALSQSRPNPLNPTALVSGVHDLADYRPGKRVFLPDEVVDRILGMLRAQERYLFMKDYLACSRVCQQWHPIARNHLYRDLDTSNTYRRRRHELLYRRLLADEGLSASVGWINCDVDLDWTTYRIMQLCPNLRSVSTHIHRRNDIVENETLAFLSIKPYLWRISLSGWSSEALMLHLPNFRSLSQLVLRAQDFGNDRGLEDFPLIPTIKDLHLVNCKWPAYRDGFPKHILARHAPTLQGLHFDRRIPSTGGCDLAFPNLKTLALRNLYWIDVTVILQAAPNIQALELRSCILDKAALAERSTLPKTLRELTIFGIEFDFACEMLGKWLGDPSWLPNLSKLPRITFSSPPGRLGLVDPTLAYSRKLEGISIWQKRAGRPASMDEKAAFLLEEAYWSV